MVETDAGLTGLGDAYGDPLLMPSIVERRLAPMAVGLDPRDIAGLWKKLFASREFWEIGGSVLCGISAIEVACWDIRGQAEGVGVCELLGGRNRRDAIEAYASDLHWDEPQVMAEMAAGYVERGFRYVKTHIGAPGERDRDLRALRGDPPAIGPDVGYMIDINTAFDRADGAGPRPRVCRLRPVLVRGAPLSAGLAGTRLLRQRAGPEDRHGREPLHDARLRAAAGRATAATTPCPTSSAAAAWSRRGRSARWPGGKGIIATPHNFSSGVGLAATLHLMAALPETQLLEFDPTGTAVYEELFIEPLVVEGGCVHVPRGPGLGVRLTEEVLRKYAVT